MHSVAWLPSTTAVFSFNAFCGLQPPKRSQAMGSVMQMLIASPVKVACIASDIIAIQHQSTTPKEDNNMKAIGPISQIRRKRVIAGLATLSIMLAGQSLAHSGGLDSRGCHAGTQPYHCHRDRSSFNWEALDRFIGIGVDHSIIGRLVTRK